MRSLSWVQETRRCSSGRKRRCQFVGNDSHLPHARGNDLAFAFAHDLYGLQKVLI